MMKYDEKDLRNKKMLLDLSSYKWVQNNICIMKTLNLKALNYISFNWYKILMKYYNIEI